MTTTVKYFVLFNDEKNMVDGYEEALIFVGKLIDRHVKNVEYAGKWIDIIEHTMSESGSFDEKIIGRHEIKEYKIMKTNVVYLVSINTNTFSVETLEEALIFVGRLIERLSKDEEFVGKWIEVSEHTTDAIKGFYQTMIGKYEIKDSECLSE